MPHEALIWDPIGEQQAPEEDGFRCGSSRKAPAAGRLERARAPAPGRPGPPMTGRTGAMVEGEMPARLREAVYREMSGYCERRVPTALRSRLRLSFRMENSSVTLFETRMPMTGQGGWRTLPLARLRYAHAQRRWYLERPDGQGAWRRSALARPARTFNALLRALDRGPERIFWG